MCRLVKMAARDVSDFWSQVEAPRSLAGLAHPGLNYRYTGIDHITQGWPDALEDRRT